MTNTALYDRLKFVDTLFCGKVSRHAARAYPPGERFQFFRGENEEDDMQNQNTNPYQPNQPPMPNQQGVPGQAPMPGQPQYPYQPMQQYPPPYPQMVVVQKQSNGMGTAGFVLALISLFFGWVAVAGWILWLLGTIFSFVGLFKAPRGLAIAGIIISFIDIIVIIAVIATFWAGVGSFSFFF